MFDGINVGAQGRVDTLSRMRVRCNRTPKRVCGPHNLLQFIIVQLPAHAGVGFTENRARSVDLYHIGATTILCAHCAPAVIGAVAISRSVENRQHLGAKPDEMAARPDRIACHQHTRTRHLARVDSIA